MASLEGAASSPLLPTTAYRGPRRTSSSWLRSASNLRAWRHRAEVIGCCTAYTLVGPSVIMVNNHIIKTLHFPCVLPRPIQTRAYDSDTRAACAGIR